jgi:HupE / UreJ protein
MSRGGVPLGLTGLVLLLAGAPAQAHTRSESHSSWVIDNRQVRTTITFPDKEAEYVGHGSRPSDEELLTYLTARIGVSAAGRTCSLAVPGHMLQSATGYRRGEYVFDCPTDKNLVLQFAAFVDLVPSHVDFAQIQFADGDVVEQLFSQGDTRLDLSESQGGKYKSAGFIDFVKMGIMHIFTGVDHMSFLLGLVLISRRLRDLVFVVSGFTLGHSITLALAVTGIIRPHAQYIDALVALTIALVGVENVVVSLDKPSKVALSTGGFLLVMALLSFLGIGVLPPALLLGTAIFSAAYLLISGQLHESGRLRMVVTTIFGLIHGFGFAADLLEARLPPEKLAQILFGFNIGVEVGQLTIVLAVSGLVILARRIRLATPRPITVDLLGSALIAEGVAWFLSRSFA